MDDCEEIKARSTSGALKHLLPGIACLTVNNWVTILEGHRQDEHFYSQLVPECLLVNELNLDILRCWCVYFRRLDRVSLTVFPDFSVVVKI